MTIESRVRGATLAGIAVLFAGCATRSATPAPRDGSPRGAGSEGAGETENLAKKLSNPVADLISVPFQFNYDNQVGPTESGETYRLNVQPVIPISLTAEWNLISRTIVPLVDLEDVAPGTDQSGLGDVLQSAFFSPGAPTAGGWIFGAGPVLLLPTGTDELLTGRKWGAGPTGVALRQTGPWTWGALANHVWSFAGDADRDDVNATYLQPFLSHTTATATTFVVNTESTFDWEEDEWSVPLNFAVAQIVRVGKLPVQFQIGARWWVDSPDDGPEGWGGRFAITFLFPK